ncbi:DUF4102 domain-containing protein [Bosea caraganae]|uniref:DUF4102 domain-containing protein n=1 Tax=Bosea caraganae TaxID=2763117 RepID=A0A370KYS0_9HYPH|nr:DUF4102 domain-containing protein [Bosea caraganae]RDJ24861.1 DUF4102 domain-containing protein [Bosea caraganae]
MPLTDVAIRNAKAQDKVVKLSDGEGLQLWVMPTGSKLWRLAYRIDGKQKKLAIGPYPEIDLRTARERRDAAKKQLRDGKDPSAEKKVAKLTAASARGATFNVRADMLIEAKEKANKAERTLSKVRWLLGLARPDLGRRPIGEITSAETLAVLRKLEKKNHLETAKRLRSTLSEVFRAAIIDGLVVSDPTAALRGAIQAPVTVSHAALTKPKQLGQLLRAIDGFDGQPTTRTALQLMAMLYPRPGELRFARWEEFDFQLKEWLIPADRMKMRIEHYKPLPHQAIVLLEELRDATEPLRDDAQSALLFPSMRSTKRPMSENTLNAALRRLGYANEEHVAHGFRSSASTLLNESKLWHADAVERSLAHEEPNKVRRAYARGEYWEERVKMAQWWADQVDLMRAGAKFHWPAER